MAEAYKIGYMTPDETLKHFQDRLWRSDIALAREIYRTFYATSIKSEDIVAGINHISNYFDEEDNYTDSSPEAQKARVEAVQHLIGPGTSLFFCPYCGSGLVPIDDYYFCGKNSIRFSVSHNGPYLVVTQIPRT